MPRLLGRFTHDTPEWHEARNAGIGGSDIAALLGLSTYESRYSLWHRKAGTLGPQEQTTLTRRGHYLEPAIAAWFADQHPEYRLRRGVGTWCHTERDWQRVNPDGLITRPRGRKPLAVFEAKSDHEAWKWGTPGTDQVPIYYRCQVMWAMDVLELDVAYIAVLLGGLDFAEYVVEYNPEEAALLREEADEFLTSVRENRPPDIDDHSQTYQVIRELHPDIDGSDAEIDPDIAEWFVTAQAAKTAAEADEREARSRIADEMGSAQRAVCNGYAIARRQARNGGTPYVVAARNLPDPTDLREDSAA